MTSREYWSGRAEQNALRAYQFSLRRAQLVTRWFGRASREMQKKVNSFYRDYAGGEGISLKAAKALLTDRRALALTREAAERLSALYPDDPELHRLLRQASLQRAVAREEFLKIQLQLLASELYGETAGELRRTLTEAFEDAYYHGLYDFQQFVGYGSAFNRISTHQLEAAVTAKWSGKNYSERLWGDHRVSLARYLDRIVTTGFLEGQPSAQMTAQLQKAMNTSAYRARTLIRTESAQIASRASLLSYRENGTPQFQFLATLDLKTSEVCRAMDGKVFETADGKVGVNMPPLHPHCRSTTVPYVPNAEFDRDDTRAARGKDGTTYKVPASMSYQEWHREHVEADPEWRLAETKLQNGRADAGQYSSYRERLGEDAPKSFDEFQQIKYTEGEGWDALKRQYRAEDYAQRRELMQTPISGKGGDSAGFDPEVAKDKFLRDIETVPERQRQVLQYYAQEIEMVEDPKLPGPLAYHPTQERILYNAGHPQFSAEEISSDLMHELAHAVDSINIQSWQNKGFSSAMSAAQESVSKKLKKFKEKAKDPACSDYLSDILSALGKGGFHTFAGHDPDYWRVAGNPEKETFANLFCLQSTKKTAELEYLKESFPELIREYEKLLEELP